jgi:hypothetical protein
MVLAFGALISVTQVGFELAGDEYFFLVAGEHLSWGYADQPPLVAALARAADLLAPGSRAVLRLPMVMSVCVAAFICAVISREFGGGRRAQILSGAVFMVSPYALVHSRWVTTDAIDMACWATVFWLLIRWVRTRNDATWWAVAAVTGLALQGKYLIGVLWLLIAGVLVAIGPRDVFRRPMVAVAAAVTALSTIPSLMWQAQHGWPQAEEGPAILENVVAAGGRVTFVPSVVAALGVVGSVLFCIGTWWLVRHGGECRFLGVVIVALILVVWIGQLRPNYLGGLYPLGISVGAVRAERFLGDRRWPWRTAWAATACWTLVVLPALIPVGHQWLGGVNRHLLPDRRNDWSGLAAAVSSVAREVPEADQGGTVVIAGDYWRSSVLHRLRPAYGLPPVYGDMQGSWFFGPPPATTTTVVYVNTVPEALRRRCGSLTLVRWHSDSRVSAIYPNQDRVPISVCRGIDRPIPQIWPELRHTRLPG